MNLLNLLLVLISTLFTLVAIEIVLRFLGYSTWEWHSGKNNMPLMSVFDEHVGWKNRPGFYEYDHYDIPIGVTIQEDGSRGIATKSIIGEQGEIWFIGCSYTFGWGLSDGDEFSSIIAKNLDKFRVRNYGVPGYSTLQSLLLYDELENASVKSRKLVVLGFSDHHGSRNVASDSWLMRLKMASNRHEWISTPYARINGEGDLQIYPPKEYQKWPFSEYSVILQQMQLAYSSQIDRKLKGQQETVTFQILEKMASNIARDGNEFLVLVMRAKKSARQRYLKKFDSMNIDYVDCPEAEFPSKETRIPKDGHPNRLANQVWANCLLNKLKKRL